MVRKIESERHKTVNVIAKLQTGRNALITGVSTDKMENPAQVSSFNNEIVSTKVQLDKIISALPVGIFVVDANEDVVYANPVAETLFGKTISHSRNFRCGEFISCNNRAENPNGCGYSSNCPACPLLNAIRTILTENENTIATGEAKLNRDNIPNEMWIKYHAQKIYINDQLFVLLTTENITDEKLKNTRLRESEEKFYKAFHASPVVMSITTFDDGVFLDVNEPFLRLLGRNREEVIGKKSSDLGLWEQTNRDEIISEIDRNGYSHSKEIVLTTKSGESIPILWFGDLANINGKRCIIASGFDLRVQKKTEESLQESEKRFRILVESAPISIMLVQNGKYTYINPAGLRLLGQSDTKEVIGMDALKPIAPEYHEVIKERIKRIHDGDTNSEMEIKILKKNGESVWSTSTSVPIFIDGKPTAIFVGQNISDRKKAESSLKLYEKVVSSTSEPIAVIDKSYKYIFVNQSYEKFWGVSKEKIIGKRIPDTMGEDIFHKTVKEKVDCCMEGNFVKYSAWFESPTFGMRHMELNYYPYITDDGVINGLINISYDITSQKRIEDSLRDSEEKFRILLESAPMMIFLIQKEKIVYSNHRGANVLGFEDSQMLVGMNGIEVISPEYRKNMAERMQKIESGIDNPTIEIEMLKKDGSRMWALATSVHIIRDGEPAAIFVAKDISEQKLAQKEKSILENRLKQAQKIESIGTLSGGIAHDFNNILFPIIGMSEMLIEDLPSGSSEQENAYEILKAGLRGSELVKQILAFSRQSEHKMIPTHVQHILQEVLNLIRSTIPTNIQITQDIQSNCGLVMADPTQIHQIAMNITTNAYHAVSEIEGGVINVQLKETELKGSASFKIGIEPGRYAVLSISDNGHGMSADIIDKIFDPYFTTKEQGRGTGLGLAVVYGIVQEHRGVIKVYSEVAKGATFDIYLPLMDKPVITESLDKREQNVTGTERILLVDDEASIAKLEKLILERLGYHVTSRLNSIEALEAFKARKDDFDLVITDMSMPHMTGEQLAKELISIRPDIPIIVCTGFSEKMDEEKAREFGVKGLLMKPVVKAELAKMVRKVLDEKSHKFR